MTEDEVARIAAHFADPPWSYPGSPLYRALAPAIAADPAIHELLAERRPGQQPSFLLFGAVHGLLLAGADHELRGFYPSLVGANAAPAAGAGPAFRDFCRAYRDDLAPIVRRRLVQTNVVKRACAVAFALAAIGRRCAEPVHLIEIGSSAGLLLRFDRYRYVLGERTSGDECSPVVVRTAWRSSSPPPDLDARPPVASRTGIDLSPIDVRDPDERAWLRALVWPEDAEKAALLFAALEEAAADPAVAEWSNDQPRDGGMSNVAPAPIPPAAAADSAVVERSNGQPRDGGMSNVAPAPIPPAAAADPAVVERSSDQRRDGGMSNVAPAPIPPAAAADPAVVERPNVQCRDGGMTTLAGDAIDVLPGLAARLPAGEPRVAFHFATRMHVPPERRAAFDAAIAALGDGGPLFHFWLEPTDAPAADHRGALELRGPGDARPVQLARVHGHLEWIAPVDDA